LTVPYRNLAKKKYNELSRFYKYLAHPQDLPEEYIKLVQGSGPTDKFITLVWLCALMSIVWQSYPVA
jgi:hypothetical protein